LRLIPVRGARLAVREGKPEKQRRGHSLDLLQLVIGRNSHLPGLVFVRRPIERGVLKLTGNPLSPLSSPFSIVGIDECLRRLTSLRRA
jgi:hypothetical protein